MEQGWVLESWASWQYMAQGLRWATPLKWVLSARPSETGIDNSISALFTATFFHEELKSHVHDQSGALLRLCVMSRASDTVAQVTIGSVKSCYGHTEGTAGLTGALLAVQTLHNQVFHLPCLKYHDSAGKPATISLASFPSNHVAEFGKQPETAWLQGAAPVMHLRNMNAYVASALGDWSKSLRLAPSVPLQAAPCPSPASHLKAAGKGLSAYPNEHLDNITQS